MKVTIVRTVVTLTLTLARVDSRGKISILVDGFHEGDHGEDSGELESETGWCGCSI